MKFKTNRALCFLLVALVYVLASVGGIVLYNALPLPFWLSLLIADVAATVVVYLFSIIFGNSSVYDPYWSVQPIVIVVAYATVHGLSLSSWFIVVAICLWGVRLTANWAWTFQDLNWQDWRYTMLKEKTGKFYPLINFLGIHLFPTLVVYTCVLPAVYVIRDGGIFSPWVAVAVFVSVLAFIIQGVADVQMHKFRKSKTGGFIRNGLWKYSRHPNYLGEILMWWGIGVSSVLALGGQLYLLVGALINTLMFLVVSIPMADGRQSRKPSFAAYKAQTRMLLPIKKLYVQTEDEGECKTV